jgi:threonine synthase
MRQTLKYYSTNRMLDHHPGIIPFKETVSFREALLMGQAPDEGLFMPEKIPVISIDDFKNLKGKSYAETAMLITRTFLEGEIGENELRKIVDESYNYPVPIENVVGRKYILRLDQGPTASFKDFAARMMARLMGAMNDSGRRLNVLVATSGDTGSAVGEAFKGVAGIDVTILYPAREVSDRQKKQLDSIGENVRTLSVEGKFDDCQNLVKEAFSDPDLGRFHLTSANSINFGRILPQIVYYAWAWAQLSRDREPAVFSVPSGNFGNALGCELARRMGLPVERLVMPTNENDEFPNFLKSGVYNKVSPSRACLSNAMNVGHPSNLARFFALYGGNVDRNGVVNIVPDVEEMRNNIFSVSISDRETKKTIKRVYESYRVLLEPHGAVGWRGLEAYLEMYGDKPLCVSVETAHPAKFPDEIRELLDITPELPQGMKDIDKKSGSPIKLSADYADFKEYLTKNLKGEI